MNYLLRILAITLVTSTSALNAQPVAIKKEVQKRELSKNDFEEAKVKFLKVINSTNRQKNDSISKLVATNLTGVTAPNLGDDSLFIPWIRENLNLTNFKSVEEVILLREAWKESSTKIHQENLSLYELMSKASESQIAEIVKPFVERTEAYFSRH